MMTTTARPAGTSVAATSSRIVVSGPRWTQARLDRVLGWCYGRTPRGAVDVAAAAAAAGVTPRTVRRWLSGSGRRTAAIPSARLIELLTPPDIVDTRAEQTLTLARQVVSEWDRPARAKRSNATWADRGWLDPHYVLILQLKNTPLRQVMVTRGDRKRLLEVNRTAEILDVVQVRSRFHGLVLEAAIFAEIGPWRVVPSETVVKERRTQTWTPDAPKIDIRVVEQRLSDTTP